MPNVVGRGQNDARAVWARGWKVSTRSVDNRAERGTVVGQNPNGTALPGETILLQISSGEVPRPHRRETAATTATAATAATTAVTMRTTTDG